MLLTITVICKNEEQNIRRCLESIFKAVEKMSDFEVLLVDSYSTDGTIEIAIEYPVKVIQLGRQWPHSPAAGRYTALNHAKGKYILYLDADMELESGFIGKAINFIAKTPNCAAVTGFLKNISYVNKFNAPSFVNNKKNEDLRKKPFQQKNKVFSVPGAGLFNKSLVEEVGNFHPFLKAEEEYDLCQRLRGEGYDLWYLPVQIAKHYGYKENPLNELKRRIRNGYMAGIGQMVKLSLYRGYAKENIYRFWQHILVGGGIWSLPLFSIAGIYNSIFIVAWVIPFLSLLGLYILRKRNLGLAISAFLTKAVIGCYIWRALPFNIPVPDSYPQNVKILDNSYLIVSKN